MLLVLCALHAMCERYADCISVAVNAFMHFGGIIYRWSLGTSHTRCCVGFFFFGHQTDALSFGRLRFNIIIRLLHKINMPCKYV